MSTVKITDLPVIDHLSTNTANSIIVGVDLPSDTTGRISLKVLAEGLFANEILKVGNNENVLPNTIAQFSDPGTPFLQVNLQNITKDASGDYVATADIGTNANNYIDMGINGSLFNDPAYSAMKALDGYLYVIGSTTSSANGNLIIGTASANANVSFISGGTTTSNVVAEMSKYGFSLKNSAVVKFNDNSIQSVAAAPANYTQSAFNAANGANGLAAGAFAAANVQSGVNNTQNTTIVAVNNYAASAYASSNSQIGVNTTQNTNITLVNQYAAGAFAKANAALANATGTLSGTLTVTENLNVVDVYNNDIFMDGVLQFTTANGNITTPSGIANIKDINIKPGNELGAVSHGGDINLIAGTGGVRGGNINLTGNVNVLGVSTFGMIAVDANTPAFRIAGSANNYASLPVNQGYMLQITGFANVSSRIINDAFGANSYPVYVGRQARGSAQSPAPTQNNDVLLRIAGNGWGNNFSALGQSRIDFVATENFTDANKGTEVQIWNTSVGSNTLSKIASFNATSAYFYGTVNPQKGFIYTPTTYPGAQTAITIDFANNSVLRANTSAGITVSLANYVSGKVVELWITNTAGTNQTFTHGCSALNSTVNATTYTIPGTSTVLARYMSFDGDLGSTFVSIIHA
jgi:hypothetical protein